MKRHKSLFIHRTAEIHSNAVLGRETKIWVNVQIREKASVGKKCVISKDVYIDKNVKIGNYCKIQNSVSIYDGVKICNKVFIGPNVSFTNDRYPRAFQKEWKITKTIINDGVSIGANATIVCGVNIGRYALIAAGAVVIDDVPPFTMVAGNPAVIKYKINKYGKKIN